MAIQIHSTVDSVPQGDIKILAIVETVLAVSFTLFLAVKFETLAHIAIGCCIAPLLLLRTDESTERGLCWLNNIFVKMASRFQNIISDILDLPEIYSSDVGTPLLRFFTIIIRIFSYTIAFVAMVTFIIMIVLLSVIIRIVSTTYTLFTRCRYTINAIPTNWKRVALCLDVRYPPELMPGIENFKEMSPGEKLSDYIRLGNNYKRVRTKEEMGMECDVSELAYFIKFNSNIKRVKHNIATGKFLGVLVGIIISAMLIATVLLSYIYRWSLKSTSLVYAPLVWITKSTLDTGKNLMAHFIFIAKSALGKCVFYYSILIFTISISKVYLFFWGKNLLTKILETPGWDVLAVYLAPRQLENVGIVVDLWHVTAFINALLAISMFFYADFQISKIEQEQPWSDKLATAIIGTNIFLRYILTLYTISCVLYVTIMAIPPSEWQQISLRIVPW